MSQQQLLNDSTASAKSPSTNMHLSPTKSKKPSPLVISTDERTTNTRSHSLSPRPKDHEKGKEVAKRKDFDLEEDSQLVLETESVWAKAEALVDAVSSAGKLSPNTSGLYYYKHRYDYTFTFVCRGESLASSS